MNRCRPRADAIRRRLLRALVLLPLAAAGPLAAQVTRYLPAQSLRGDLQVLNTSEARLNSRPVRLSPALMILNAQNLRLLSGQLVGTVHRVNYTWDARTGELTQIWLLRPDELARPWPSSTAEAERWTFQPQAGLWLKP